MNLPDFQDLDLSIARARIALSLIAMLSLYIDPSTAGGLFHLNAYALTTLLCHLAYSVGIYFALGRRIAAANLQMLSIVFDLIFATAITFITEGQTSASYVFFVFAIIATARTTLANPCIREFRSPSSIISALPTRTEVAVAASIQASKFALNSAERRDQGGRAARSQHPAGFL